jgi:hypothetical protein
MFHSPTRGHEGHQEGWSGPLPRPVGARIEISRKCSTPPQHAGQGPIELGVSGAETVTCLDVRRLGTQISQKCSTSRHR